MRSFSTSYAAHIRQPVTTLAICWKITKNDGVAIFGTTHDRSIEISQTNIGTDPGSPSFDLAGVYQARAGITASAVKAADDMSVDNMNVDGALQSPAPEPNMFVDVSVEDVKAGLYDGARITVFMVNWQDPDDFQDILRHGFFGQIDWDSDGQYKTEVRGLLQILQQQIGRTCGENCDVEKFGDARCKLDLATLTVTGTVLAVTSNREFSTSLDIGSPSPESGAFKLGRLTWQTGSNVGFSGQVKDDAQSSALGDLLMHEEFPNDVQVGDTFTLTQGCDRTAARCKQLGNFVNFRGPGIFNPGMDAILRAP